MADKDTHPHHYLLHSSSSSSPSKAPSVAPSARHHQNHHNPRHQQPNPRQHHQIPIQEHQIHNLGAGSRQIHKQLGQIQHPQQHKLGKKQQYGGLGGGNGPSTSRSDRQQVSPGAGSKSRSFRDEDEDGSPLSPKKKKLKLILKLRKPPPPVPQGLRSSKVAASASHPGNGIGSAGLGSPAAGSTGASGRASPSSVRSRHLEARSAAAGNGTATTAAGGSSMELRQRAGAVTTSASASESEKATEEEGLHHSSKKRKLRDAPERRSEDERATASQTEEDGLKRKMKHDKDARFPSVSTPGHVQGSTSQHRVLEDLLERFQKKDTYGVFAEPVDPAEIPDYLEIIKEPMDFSTIKKKLAKGAYTSIELFERDVMLICSNAMKYNAPRTIYYKQAKAIKDAARKAFDGLKGRLNGQRRTAGKGPKTKRHATRRASEMTSLDAAAGPGAAADGKRVSNIERVADLSQKSNSPFQSGANDFEFAEGSLGKSVSLKDNRRLLTVDENRRNTYKPAGYRHDEGPTQLVACGYNYSGSYAQSLAMFGANFNRSAWEFVARKIRKVLAPNVPFGRGWVGEQDSSGPADSSTDLSVKESAREEAKDGQQPSEVPSSTGSTTLNVSVGFPGMFTSGAAATVGVPAAVASRPLTASSASPSVTTTSNGLFPISGTQLQSQTLAAQPNTSKHWIQNSAISSSALPTSQAKILDAVQQPRNAEGGNQQVKTVETSIKQLREQQFRNVESGVQLQQQALNAQKVDANGRHVEANSYRNVEALASHLREGSTVRKPDSQPLRKIDSQQVRSGLDINSQQLRPTIDVNTQQPRSSMDGSSQHVRNIDINFQQLRSGTESGQLRTSIEGSSQQQQKNSVDTNSHQQLRGTIDVNSQQIRKPDTIQQLRTVDSNQYRTLEANQGNRFPLHREHQHISSAENQEASKYSGSKFGANGSLSFPGIDPSRGMWSLQRAMAQESAAARETSSGLQRVFGQEQVASRSSGEAATPSFPQIPATFPNLSAYAGSTTTTSNNNSNLTQGRDRDLFQLPGQAMMSKLPAQPRPDVQQQQHQHQHRHISDLNSRSSDVSNNAADFFRQPPSSLQAGNSDFLQDHHLQQQQQQQHQVQMGVYNAISQSLLQQPWKSQAQQQRQQAPSSLRQLPPDLNVRLQSPKSPQHQHQHHHHLQQHHQQHHHHHHHLQQQQQQQQQIQQQQQQQQKQQQQQQPDLALQL